MANLLVCVKDEVKKHLLSLEQNLYFTNTKSEVFEHLNSHKINTILLIEANFIDSVEFFTLLNRRYPWVKVIILSINANEFEYKKYQQKPIFAYLDAFLDKNTLNEAINKVEIEQHYAFFSKPTSSQPHQKEQTPQNLQKDELTASFDGNFNDYTITFLDDYLIITDNLYSDIIGDQIDKLAFLDRSFSFKELINNKIH